MTRDEMIELVANAFYEAFYVRSTTYAKCAIHTLAKAGLLSDEAMDAWQKELDQRTSS